MHKNNYLILGQLWCYQHRMGFDGVNSVKCRIWANAVDLLQTNALNFGDSYLFLGQLENNICIHDNIITTIHFNAKTLRFHHWTDCSNRIVSWCICIVYASVCSHFTIANSKANNSQHANNKHITINESSNNCFFTQKKTNWCTNSDLSVYWLFICQTKL